MTTQYKGQKKKMKSKSFRHDVFRSKSGSAAFLHWVNQREKPLEGLEIGGGGADSVSFPVMQEL